jgi:hypothetical protein
MTSRHLLCCGLLASTLGGALLWVAPAAVQAAPTTHPAAADLPVLKGYYKMLEKDLDLTPDQMTKIKALQDQIDAWEKANTPKIDALEVALKKAEAEKDAAKTKELKAQLKELNAEGKKQGQASFKDGFEALLTPEQKVVKETADLYAQMMRHFADAGLSADQKAKAKTLCGDAAKEVLGLKSDDAKGKAEALAKLIKTIAQTLPVDQRAKVDGGKETAPPPGPSTRPAGK